MSYLCDLFLISIFVFIMINRMISWIYTCSFAYFLEYVLLLLDDNFDKEYEWFSNRKSSVSGSCLAFAWFFTNFSPALLIKVLLIKKACIEILHVFFISNAFFQLSLNVELFNKLSLKFCLSVAYYIEILFYGDTLYFLY